MVGHVGRCHHTRTFTSSFKLLDATPANITAGQITYVPYYRKLQRYCNMARAHRVAFLTTLFAVAYFLTFFNYLAIPLVDSKTAEEILPVVRDLASSFGTQKELIPDLALFSSSLCARFSWFIVNHKRQSKLCNSTQLY